MCIRDRWKAEKSKRKDAGDPNPDKNDFFKVIYGVEAYLVDDLKEIVTNGKGQPLKGSYVVFDIETTDVYKRQYQDYMDLLEQIGSQELNSYMTERTNEVKTEFGF